MAKQNKQHYWLGKICSKTVLTPLLPLLWKWGNGATDPYFAYLKTFQCTAEVTPVSAVLLYWLLVYGGLGRDAAQPS